MASEHYRQDIDGLRALAVLSVVFYHAGLPFFSGGYVGVDIFFVISGYLITGIIYQGLKDSTFSFKKFWLRRARRILPASLFMMIAVAIVFAFIYPPSLYRDVAQSLVAQLLFASNFLFTKEASYFNQLSEIKPLLHTWSLAVEEQFYFIFPFVLYLIHRYAQRYIILILSIICTFSLLISIWPESAYPGGEFFPVHQAGFFLLPSRGWELGAGAILAVITVNHPSSPSNLMSSVMGVLGLILVSIAIILFNDQTPFPSYYALLPVMGTVLLIAANSNQSGLISHLFTTKIATTIGLISYALYLWHWPVFIVFDYFFAHDNLLVKVCAIITSIVLATLSYLLIENPIRRNYNLFSNKIVVAALGSLCLILLIGGSVALKNKGQAFQVSFAQEPMTSMKYRQCFDNQPDQSEATFCEINTGAKEDYSFIVIGDSYAHSLIPAIEEAAIEAGRTGIFSSERNCLPFFGGHIYARDEQQERCSDILERAFKQIRKHDIQNLILIAKWSNYMDRSLHNEQSTLKMMWDNTASEFLKHNTNIIIVEQPPAPGYEPRGRYYKNLPNISLSNHQQRNSIQHKFFSEYRDVKLINLDSALCLDNFSCSLLDNNDQLYSDFDHLSLPGALKTKPLFLSLLKEM